MSCGCAGRATTAAAAGAAANPAVILIQSPFDSPILPTLGQRIATVQALPHNPGVRPPNWVLLGVVGLILAFIYVQQNKGRG